MFEKVGVEAVNIFFVNFTAILGREIFSKFAPIPTLILKLKLFKMATFWVLCT